MLELIVQVPGRPDEAVSVPLPAGGISVASLIRARAGAEWDGSRRIGREAAPPRPGDAPEPRNRDEAIHMMLDAFRAGWFMVFVDDEPAASLDATPTLKPGTRVRFARLYPGSSY